MQSFQITTKETSAAANLLKVALKWNLRKAALKFSYHIFRDMLFWINFNHYFHFPALSSNVVINVSDTWTTHKGRDLYKSTNKIVKFTHSYLDIIILANVTIFPLPLSLFLSHCNRTSNLEHLKKITLPSMHKSRTFEIITRFPSCGTHRLFHHVYLLRSEWERERERDRLHVCVYVSMSRDICVCREDPIEFVIISDVPVYYQRPSGRVEHESRRGIYRYVKWLISHYATRARFPRLFRARIIGKPATSPPLRTQVVYLAPIHGK